jgi:hypothetical protein
VNAGTKKGLASIDISDSDHYCRVHQKSLDRPPSSRCRSRQCRSFDRWIEGLYPETRKMSILPEARRRPDQNQAESARISKTQLAPIVEEKAQVLVRLTRVARGRNRQTAAHPQMDHQGRRPFEVDQQVFRPPPEPTDESALAPLAQISRSDTLAQICLTNLDADDPPAREPRSQTATKDLHLRELWHAKIVAWVCPKGSLSSASAVRRTVPEAGPTGSKTQHVSASKLLREDLTIRFLRGENEA